MNRAGQIPALSVSGGAAAGRDYEKRKICKVRPLRETL